MPHLDSVFWERIWGVLQRILGAILLLGIHLLLDFLFNYAFREYEWLKTFVSTTLLLAFLIVYFLIIIDIVIIFLPKRRVRRKGGRHVVKHTEG